MIHKLTPKEKAIELANEFLKTGMLINQAKKCVIITVDELIFITGDSYWYLVKTETQKL